MFDEGDFAWPNVQEDLFSVIEIKNQLIFLEKAITLISLQYIIIIMREVPYGTKVLLTCIKKKA